MRKTRRLLIFLITVSQPLAVSTQSGFPPRSRGLYLSQMAIEYNFQNPLDPEKIQWYKRRTTDDLCHDKTSTECIENPTFLFH